MVCAGMERPAFVLENITSGIGVWLTGILGTQGHITTHHVVLSNQRGFLQSLSHHHRNIIYLYVLGIFNVDCGQFFG
jgi:hypothetical protein